MRRLIENSEPGTPPADVPESDDADWDVWSEDSDTRFPTRQELKQKREDSAQLDTDESSP